MSGIRSFSHLILLFQYEIPTTLQDPLENGCLKHRFSRATPDKLESPLINLGVSVEAASLLAYITYKSPSHLPLLFNQTKCYSFKNLFET